jgi:hypothetical protein
MLIVNIFGKPLYADSARLNSGKCKLKYCLAILMALAMTSLTFAVECVRSNVFHVLRRQRLGTCP